MGLLYPEKIDQRLKELKENSEAARAIERQLSEILNKNLKEGEAPREITVFPIHDFLQMDSALYQKYIDYLFALTREAVEKNYTNDELYVKWRYELPSEFHLVLF